VTHAGAAALAVRLHGAWQDRSLDYAAEVLLSDTSLLMLTPATTPTPIEFAFNTLSGAVLRDGVLTIWQQDGTTVSVSGSSHLDGFRRRLEAAVCVFPAQTLSLRGFGSESSAPGSDHDRWFEQLLLARRVAEETRTIETQRRAFDPVRLRRHAQQTREAWAAARCAAHPADQRALIAELEELATGYATALDGLERWSVGLRAAAEGPSEFVVWRSWTESVHRCFAAADEVWSRAVPVLADARGASGALWRRVLRRNDAAS
jgi:hypothetical protein